MSTNINGIDSLDLNLAGTITTSLSGPGELAIGQTITAGDITGVAILANTNTFVPLQKFTAGIEIGTAPQVAILEWQSSVFLIEAVVGGTTPIAMAFEAFGTAAVGGFQSTTAEVAFVQETQISGNTYQGFCLTESNPSNFFSGSNTIEYQIGAAKNATPGTIPVAGFAVGDVTVVSNLPLVASSDLTVGGHLISDGAPPTIAADTGAGTSPTIAVTGSDMAGTVSITTGTGCAANSIVVAVTFSKPFTSNPTVLLTPANAATAALGNASVYPVSISTDFALEANATALSDSTAYAWNYLLIEP